MEIVLNVNGQQHTVDAPEDMPLLWVLRDLLRLKGTKFGCGVAMCGACTVHVDGVATRSCVMPASALEGSQIVTIEGLANEVGTVLQDEWVRKEVSQCGYCQPGQIMQAASMLQENPELSDEDLEMGLWGNICRCGTYGRIKVAIKAASARLAGSEASNDS